MRTCIRGLLRFELSDAQCNSMPAFCSVRRWVRASRYFISVYSFAFSRSDPRFKCRQTPIHAQPRYTNKCTEPMRSTLCVSLWKRRDRTQKPRQIKWKQKQQQQSLNEHSIDHVTSKSMNCFFSSWNLMLLFGNWCLFRNTYHTKCC